MLTVVAKLFGLVRPDAAYFGEKDYQQQVLVRQMSADLELGVDVVTVPTVRDPDGLAVSSRNIYLSAADRQQALGLSPRACAPGSMPRRPVAAAVLAAARRRSTRPRRRLPGPAGARPGRRRRTTVRRGCSVAVRVGTTRLIDNVEVIALMLPTAPAGPSAGLALGNRRGDRRIGNCRAVHRAADRSPVALCASSS